MSRFDKRIYGLAPGVDFPKALVDGLCTHFKDDPPEKLARVDIILNTERMLRRVQKLFGRKSGILHPRLHLVTNLNALMPGPNLIPAVSKLATRFELIELVDKLISEQPDLAARSSLYALADSLAKLIDEMAGEGVDPETITSLDVSDQSGHWERAQKFVEIAQRYLELRDITPDGTLMQRKSVLSLMDLWEKDPPKTPVIVAGSTGSRGTTMLLMKAVAKLPQGVLLLPGFDFDMPEEAWELLSTAAGSEDHPQTRFHKLFNETGIKVSEIANWQNTPPPCPMRNAFVSLALRPAPVTDAWLKEGPKLGSLEEATKGLTLLEAPDMRQEALAIALRLKEAVHRGEVAALISPDRQLTRQVTAALDRWDILPDDSAGLPLHLSATGRFLRQVGQLLSKELTSGALLALLKHPLTHSGGARSEHLRLSRELELYLRAKRVAFPNAAVIEDWTKGRKEPEAVPWADWLCHAFLDKTTSDKQSFQSHFETHFSLCHFIALGHAPDEQDGASPLWEGKEGGAVAKTCAAIQEAMHRGGVMHVGDYVDIFSAVLAEGEIRDPLTPHPNVLIWGTLEARVQGADLVILGGLNEGSWPKVPTPDPWLNRSMRQSVGLLLPERQIGLSAHDFQQAVGVKQVWITRSIRSDEAETVPSRWVNRMVNLLNGLPALNGPHLLENMRARGAKYLGYVKNMEAVKSCPPALRISPRPPVSARPRQLSATEIKTLIRDPYAIYAKRILNLRAIDPLDVAADPQLRGIVVHKVFERFMKDWPNLQQDQRRQRLLSILDEELGRHVPWALARAYWRNRIEAFIIEFLNAEAARQNDIIHSDFEADGKITLGELNFTLVARADRIHVRKDQSISLFDYKTGAPPTPAQQRVFDKQLYLMAAIAEEGGFNRIAPAPVSEAAFIGLGGSGLYRPAPFGEESVQAAWEKFKNLIAAYGEKDQGYTPRRALFKAKDFSEYDQLSRFGEWDITQEPKGEDLE